MRCYHTSPCGLYESSSCTLPPHVLHCRFGRETPDTMKVFYSDHFVLPLPEGHRFPMVKYSMLRDRIVLETCRERGIPVALTMAGGYASEVDDTVDVHFQSIRRAADLLDRVVDESKVAHRR